MMESTIKNFPENKKNSINMVLVVNSTKHLQIIDINSSEMLWKHHIEGKTSQLNF